MSSVPPFAPPSRFDAPPQNAAADSGQNGAAQPPFTPARQQPALPQKRAEAAAMPRARFFRSEKTYGHEAGFSCCFRQWRAGHSHCRLLHGYALSFRFRFIACSLDKHGWVMDFGGLKPIKAWLEQNFDHKILLAEDDPARAVFQNMAQAGLCAVNILPFVGCEAFAYYIWQNTDALARQISQNRARVESVEVREHGGNAALFKAENLFAEQ